LWRRGGAAGGELPITRLSGAQRGLLALVTTACVALVGWLFSRYTDAHLPFWDAAAAGVSVTAQAVMLRKKIECWPLWLAVDVVYVGIYLYKQVYLTAGLYALFLVLAALGWREWRSAERAQEGPPRLLDTQRPQSPATDR
jgi:nicotinamide mononucleotide transporter